MRLGFVVLILAGIAWPHAAMAYENFIPLGQNYAPGDDQLPPLNSAADRFNAQVDVYETDIYTKQRGRKEFQSQIYNFFYTQEPDVISDHLDY